MPENTQPGTSLTLARDLFLTAKEAERCTARTLQTYRWTLDKFIIWLATQGVSDAQGITAHQVRLFLAQLDKGHRAGYVHGYARVIKTWLRFLHADGILAADVMAQVAMPRLDKQILPAFTPDEGRALLDACADALDAERDTALVLLLLDTGVRAAELCALTVGDVDTKSGAVTIKHGKGRKDRTAYIGAKARRAMLRYLLLARPTAGKDEPLFPSHKTGDHLTPNGLILFCRRLGQRAGVDNCHPHKFRRTCAIWSLRAGMDLIRLAAMLGHEDLTILQRYLKLVETDLQTAHKEHGAVNGVLGKKGGDTKR